MTQYVLVNNVEKVCFEKKYQLPFGCWNTAIYNESNLNDAILMLKNMSPFKRYEYNIEMWKNGVFVEVIINGSEMK